MAKLRANFFREIQIFYYKIYYFLVKTFVLGFFLDSITPYESNLG